MSEVVFLSSNLQERSFYITVGSLSGNIFENVFIFLLYTKNMFRHNISLRLNLYIHMIIILTVWIT